jgi:hypothetical protein
LYFYNTTTDREDINDMTTIPTTDRPATDAELPRRIRRPLVVLALVGYPLSVFCWTIAQTWLGLPPVVGGIIGLALVPAYVFAMWRIYEFRNHLAQAPDDQLDERQIRVRDRAYLESYRAFVAVTLLGLAALAIIPDLIDQPITLTYDVVQWLVMGAILLSLILPSAVVAWNEPDLAAE